jgi:hypothetical protein
VFSVRCGLELYILLKIKFTPQNVSLRAAYSSGTYKFSRKSHVKLHRVITEVRKLRVYLQLHLLPPGTKTNRVGHSLRCVPEIDRPSNKTNIKIIYSYIKPYVYPAVILNGKHVEEGGTAPFILNLHTKLT